MAIRHTYGVRRRHHPYGSSPTTSPQKLSPIHSNKAVRQPLRVLDNTGRIGEPKQRPKNDTISKPRKKLTQLHFDVPNTLKACDLCGLSYTIGAAEDEALHKRQCHRATKGLEWSTEEEKDAVKANLRVIDNFVSLKSQKVKGRIISVDCKAAGKIGRKMSSILETINLSLSAPPLTTATLNSSKAYLFLSPSSSRSRIVGAVIVTRIEKAMRVAKPAENDDKSKLVSVDGGLYCHPEPLSSSMGVSRLFVSSEHRRRGIASALLSAASATYIHGCPLNVEDGHIAFSQPTRSGQAVMEKWGRGFVRIYEE